MAGTDPYGLASNDGFYAPEPVDIPSSHRRTPGAPIPPPGTGLRLHSVDGNSAAANHIRCEESRIATHVRPWAGRLSNDWTGEGWFHSAVVEGNNPFHEWLAQNVWLRFHSEEWINSPGAVWETVAIAVVAAVLIVKAAAIARLVADDWGKVGLHTWYWERLVAAGLAEASGAAKLAWMFRTYPWLPFLAPITSVLAGDGWRLRHTGPTPLLGGLLRPALWLWQQATRLWWMMLSSSTQGFDSAREALAALLPKPDELIADATYLRHHQSTDST